MSDRSPVPTRFSPLCRSLAHRVGRGRGVVIAMLGLYALLLAALGGHSGWDALGVPDVTPLFFDLHSITAGWECTRMGLDVLVENPCDPGLRPPNYPRIWMAPAGLGLGQGSTVAIGVGLVAVFLAAAVAVLPRDASTASALAFGLALCSPAVMLGVERGNVDLLVYVLVALAAVGLGRNRHGTAVSAGLVVAAAILKLFPVFAAAMFVRRATLRSLAALGAVLAIFAAYVVVTRDDIRAIAAVVPQTDYYSYGVRLLTERLARGTGRPLVWDAAIVAIALLPVLLGRSWLRSRLTVDAIPRARRDLDLLWAGAAIYVFTYVAFRSFDYRLVFLTLTIPPLVGWAAERARLPAVVLCFVLATLWLGPVTDATGIELAPIAELGLFSALSGVLVATAPNSLFRAPAWILSRRGSRRMPVWLDGQSPEERPR